MPKLNLNKLKVQTCWINKLDALWLKLKITIQYSSEYTETVCAPFCSGFLNSNNNPLFLDTTQQPFYFNVTNYFPISIRILRWRVKTDLCQILCEVHI